MNEPTKKHYEPPAIIYRAELEAAANACAWGVSRESNAPDCPPRGKGGNSACTVLRS